MLTFQQYLTELSLFTLDNKIPSKGGELAFARLIIKMINDSNPSNNFKTLKSEIPITISFGEHEHNKVVEGITSVLYVGNKTTENSKADFILNTESGSVPVSLKMTDYGRFGKYRTIGEKLKKYLINKGVDITSPILYRLPDDIAHASMFGSDILPNGFIFKTNAQGFESIGKHTYHMDGKVITSLGDLSDDEMPVLTISSGSVPEIRVKHKQGSRKEVQDIPEDFAKRYMNTLDN